MALTSTWLCAITVLLAIAVQSQAQSNAANEKTNVPSKPNNSDGKIYAEEIVVESSLYVHNPSTPKKSRASRNVIYYLMPDASFAPSHRTKRQSGFYPNQGFGNFNNGYGNSQSSAQSGSHSNYFGPDGFLDANALAAAQGFQSSSPTGSFGATSSNANTQNLASSPLGGSSGGASNSGGQTYQLPNGQTVSLTFNNGFSFLPNSRPSTSQGSSVAVSGPLNG